jgi:predicted phage tail protein
VGGFYQDAANNEQAFVDSAAPLFSVPKAPALRVAPKTNGTALVTITNAAANGGSPITEYQYSLNGGGWVNSSKHARTSFTVLNLKVGTTYRLAVRAVNIVGTGPSSAHKSFRIA